MRFYAGSEKLLIPRWIPDNVRQQPVFGFLPKNRCILAYFMTNLLQTQQLFIK